MSPNMTGANASKASKARWIVPLILVNSVAILGQTLWAWNHLVPEAWRGGWGMWAGVPVALGFASALESIGIYLSAEADERAKASQPYGLLRAGAYGMGLVAGGLNFWHFAGTLTGVATVTNSALTLASAMGLLSTLSPILWAIRSKRLNRAALILAGAVEPRLLRLGMGRKALHPVLSFHLVRWATWEGLQDVGEAVAAWDQAGRPKSVGKAGTKPAAYVVAEAEAILAEARRRAAVEAEAILGEAEAQRAAVVVEAEAILTEAERQAEAELAEAARQAETQGRAAVEAEAILGEAEAQRAAVVVEAEAILAEARRRAEAELAEAARQAESDRRAAVEARRRAETEAAEILAAAEALANEAKATAPAPIRDEVAEARRRREAAPKAEAPADMIQAVADLADELGRCPRRDEVKTLCRVGSSKADDLIAAYRAAGEHQAAGGER